MYVSMYRMENSIYLKVPELCLLLSYKSRNFLVYIPEIFLLDHYLRDFVLKDKLPYIHSERTKVLVLNFFKSAGILSLALVNKN